MTIIQLEYLLAVANFGSFSIASEHCFVTQPSLSMQIKALEEELGVMLLDRSKKPVVPTEAGEVVLAQVRETLREFHSIKEVVQQIKGEVSGKIRLGVIPTIAPYLLISEPFSNWQAMRDTGGRRIKRSLNIDMNSVQFMDDDAIAKLGEDKIISQLISSIKTTTEESEVITNLDLYMRAINRYIDLHPRVNHTMIAMVRQLQPTEWGLPVELYFFTADVNWVPHEHLQAEIMSRIIALAPHFGLRLYQAPSGQDLKIK